MQAFSVEELCSDPNHTVTRKIPELYEFYVIFTSSEDRHKSI
ncbi:MAG: hypothetical protein BMS9Abin26_0938 [Gammaproteobacteria bacterium]|nr:MAG: hypothetical protein BMS9Abin26_0938 [Gammaproteobacteria bacterium]